MFGVDFGHFGGGGDLVPILGLWCWISLHLKYVSK